LGNIERGKENPTLDTLLRLAASLKVGIGKIFVVQQENPSVRDLQKKIQGLLREADPDRLRVTVKFLESILH